MANGILYFSGTGNSLYIAKRIQEEVGGDIKFIPNYKGNGQEYAKACIQINTKAQHNDTLDYCTKFWWDVMWCRLSNV